MPGSKKISFAGKNFLQYFIPLFLVFGMMLVGRLVVNTNKCDLDQQQRGKACVNVVHRATDNLISLLLADLQYLASLDAMRTFLSVADDIAREKLSEQYGAFMARRNMYSSLSYLSENGILTLRVSSNPCEEEKILGEKMMDFSHVSFFKRAMLLEKGEFYLSDSLEYTGAVTAEKSGFPILIAATPIFNANGKKKGIVVIEYITSQLVKELEGIGEAFDGKISIANKWGDEFIRVGHDKNLTIDRKLEKSLSIAINSPESWTKISDVDNGQIEERQKNITFATYYPHSIERHKDEVRREEENNISELKTDFYWKIIFEPTSVRNDIVKLVFKPQSVVISILFLLISALMAAVFLIARRERAEGERNLIVHAFMKNKTPLVVVDRLGDIVFANEAFCVLSGLGKAETQGRNLRDVCGEVTDWPSLAMWESLRSSEPWEGEVVNERNGTGKFWENMSIIPLCNGLGIINHFIVERRDISQQKLLEVELKRLSSIAEEHKDMILDIDQHGTIVFANKACIQRFPSMSDALQHPLCAGLEDFWSRIGKEIREDFNDEVTIDGCAFLRQVKFKSELGLLRIYTAEKTQSPELEQSLLKARKEAAAVRRMKSLILANMGHEFRTPLNVILGYCDLMLMRASQPEDKKRLEIINKAGKDLLCFINEILELAKIEENSEECVVQEFSITRVLDDIKNKFASQAAEKGIEFHLTGCDELPDRVIGDGLKLRRILNNLLDNSFKFTEKGFVNLHCGFEHGTVVLMLTDTGIGIARKQQKDIFSEFQQGDGESTRKYGGTGLGLSVTNRLVSLMNGSISLKSELGEGATFTVRLPFPQAHSTTQRSEHVSNNKESSYQRLRDSLESRDVPFRVLLAEDNQMNQHFIHEMLVNIGIQTIVAENGQEALDRLAEGDFELLLLDMQMPVLDGMQTIEKIRAHGRWKNLFVIALTGEALPEDKQKFLQMGCNDYMAKPLDLGEFYQKIYLAVTSRRVPEPPGNETELQKLQPDAAAQGMVLSKELCENLAQAIKILKQNLKIFNPDQIRLLSSSFDTFNEIKKIGELQQELLEIATSFDDEALPSFVRKLETLYDACRSSQNRE